MDAIKFVHEQMTEKKDYPDFRPGDNVVVSYKIVEGAKERIDTFDRIVSSPYPRALQTADIAAETLSWKQDIAESSLLTPESSPQQLLEWIDSESGNLFLVGHNPLLSRTLNLLIGAETGREHMDTSSLAAIQFDVSAPSCGELLWLLHRF